MQPFGRNGYGPKIEGLCRFLGRVERGLHLTPSRLGWGLAPYQVASWPMQPFDRKLGGGCAPLWEGELGPHLTQCGQGRGLPACQVSSWSVQPFDHSARTLQTDRTDKQRTDSIGRTVLQTVAPKSSSCALLSSTALQRENFLLLPSVSTLKHGSEIKARPRYLTLLWHAIFDVPSDMSGIGAWYIGPNAIQTDLLQWKYVWGLMQTMDSRVSLIIEKLYVGITVSCYLLVLLWIFYYSDLLMPAINQDLLAKYDCSNIFDKLIIWRLCFFHAFRHRDRLANIYRFRRMQSLTGGHSMEYIPSPQCGYRRASGALTLTITFQNLISSVPSIIYPQISWISTARNFLRYPVHKPTNADQTANLWRAGVTNSQVAVH